LPHQLCLLLLLQQRLTRKPFLPQSPPLLPPLLLLLLPLLLRLLRLRCGCKRVKHIYCDIHGLLLTNQQLACHSNANGHSSSLCCI
jgi:hypothetical protein